MKDDPSLWEKVAAIVLITAYTVAVVSLVMSGVTGLIGMCK